MKRASVPTRTALIVAAVTFIAACNGNAGTQPVGSSVVTSAAPRILNVSVAREPATIRRDLGKSWISPDIANAPRLLFASDYATGYVTIFTLPGLAMKGQIAGFSGPQGMCSDSRGNVWVASTTAFQVLELSRSGAVINTINDSYGYPVACAVNPTNNEIAVFNLYNINGGAGGIYLYSCPSCSPIALTIPGICCYYFGGYDPAGDLFVDGEDSGGPFLLGEVPDGSSSGYVINISGGTIFFPGLVQWYKPGNYLAVGDQLCGKTPDSCIYWITISGQNGTITGQTDPETPNGGFVCDLVQGALDPVGEKNIVGADYDRCHGSPSSENRWAYPAGGVPTNSIERLGEPIGAAISVK